MGVVFEGNVDNGGKLRRSASTDLQNKISTVGEHSGIPSQHDAYQSRRAAQPNEGSQTQS
jgi:hypothetical protein